MVAPGLLLFAVTEGSGNGWPIIPALSVLWAWFAQSSITPGSLGIRSILRAAGLGSLLVIPPLVVSEFGLATMVVGIVMIVAAPLLVPACAGDRLGVRAGVRRSGLLARGNRARILAAGLLVFLVYTPTAGFIVMLVHWTHPTIGLALAYLAGGSMFGLWMALSVAAYARLREIPSQADHERWVEVFR